MTSLTSLPSWTELQRHAATATKTHLRDLFGIDPKRGKRFSLQACALYLDYSRERIVEETLPLLLKLAGEAGLPAARKKLFDGGIVNPSENRPALHPALRAADPPNEIREMRDRMLDFAESLRGGPIQNIVHVGIGGSNIGPWLLEQGCSRRPLPRMYYIINVDAEPLKKFTQNMLPAETLVIMVSKSFTTEEVLRNGKTLQEWLGPHAATNLLAATAAPKAAEAFGVLPKNIFPMHEAVGGRFSVWSSASLSAAAVMGRKNFEEFLAGGADMDAHFQNAPLAENMPVLLALLGLWNINILGCRARAVVPYAARIRLFPTYLQQLEMESLGKSFGLDNAPLNYATAPVIFGLPGTPAQHTFMQALHQGTELIPAEFIVVANDAQPAEHRSILQGHALAQADALAFGKEDKDMQKNIPGNKPSSILVMHELAPRVMGQLLALYEHKVFVQGVLWNINPFDQWGVELGKKLAGPMELALAGGAAAPHLTSLIQAIRKN